MKALDKVAAMAVIVTAGCWLALCDLSKKAIKGQTVFGTLALVIVAFHIELTPLAVAALIWFMLDYWATIATHRTYKEVAASWKKTSATWEATANKWRGMYEMWKCPKLGTMQQKAKQHGIKVVSPNGNRTFGH
jgi:hypothetical protein